MKEKKNGFEILKKWIWRGKRGLSLVVSFPDPQGSVDPAWIAELNGAISQNVSKHAALVARVIVGVRNKKALRMTA